MSLLFKLFTISPLDETVPKLFQDFVITVPGFEIDCQPRSFFRAPAHSSFLKSNSSAAEQRRYTFQLFVVLVDRL